MAGFFGAVHDFAAFGVDVHLFARHFVLRQVFYVRLVEASESAVERDEGRLDAFDFHALELDLLKCIPAVGAVTAPSWRAKMHWKRSKSSGSAGR